MYTGTFAISASAIARSVPGRLGDLGPGERVVDRRGVALRERALDQHVDRQPVLGVHA